MAFAGLDLAVRITILRCSFLDFIPLAMSEVVSHIASFYVWQFWVGPGYMARLSVPSVSLLTGAVVGAVSVGTIRSHVTSTACNEALIDI